MNSANWNVGGIFSWNVVSMMIMMIERMKMRAICAGGTGGAGGAGALFITQYVIHN